MSWREEYWRSIKSPDTEEKLDLYFYRPVGFVIAKAAKWLRLTPDHLTVTGALLGVAAGPFFYFNESTSSLIAAALLLIFAGIFDSSDGQLARMGGGKGSKFGLVLDGICDNIVFGACYVGSTLALHALWGWPVWILAVAAGFFHSLQSSALDYYNREYLVFGYGKIDGDYWNPSNEEARKEAEEAQGLSKLMLKSRLSWIWQQNKLSPRTQAQRQEWRRLLTGPKAEEFKALYREHNRGMLPWWALMGPNFHTIMILLFVFLRRFDLYLLLVDVLFLTLALFLLRGGQRRRDLKLGAALKARGLA
jgi:phosphatidylglycerophosphate synthase